MSTPSSRVPASPNAIVPYERWRTSLPEMAARFGSAEPYPHIVIDNFLTPEAAEVCLREFPAIDSAWINYTHVNERKYGKSDRAAFPPGIRRVMDELISDEFVQFVERLTGIDSLLADPELAGGGLHQSGNGGYLNIHADFTGHPRRARWRRRVNLLVYLNRDWQSSFGGRLELWDRGMTRAVEYVEPLFNRAVLFRTDPDSYHGHPDPMTCPESFTRKSLALYYFTDEAQAFRVRSTEYKARPGDGIRAAWIYLDKMALRGYDKVKRTFGLSDKFASKLLKIFGGGRKK